MHAFNQVSPPQAGGLVPRIRLCLALVMACLILAGVAAFAPIQETRWLLDVLSRSANFGVGSPSFTWILGLNHALIANSQSAPFLAYSGDCVALAQILFALVFIGPFLHPVRNQWVITFGLICCAGVVLLAFIAGPIRDIPFFWRLVDSALAIFCALPLLLCRHYVLLLEHLERTERRRTRNSRQRRLRRNLRRSIP